MPWANRLAQGGARTISAVLFAMGTKDMLESFRDLNSTATLAVGVVIWQTPEAAPQTARSG